MRVLRDLPGVAELEARLARIAAHPSPLWAKEGDTLGHDADLLSRQLFGLTVEDTYFDDEVEGAGIEEDEDPDSYDEARDAWEANFALLGESRFWSRPATDPGVFRVWEAMGWDVTDGNGKEMLATEFLGRPMIALAKGLRTPNASRPMSASEELSLEARLKAEAEKFRRGK